MPLASFFNVWQVLNGSTKVHEIFVDFLGCPCKNTSQIVTKIEDVISPCAFYNAVLHVQAYKAWRSPKIPAHKWGGGGGPPLGGVNGILPKWRSLKTVQFFIDVCTIFSVSQFSFYSVINFFHYFFIIAAIVCSFAHGSQY